MRRLLSGLTMAVLLCAVSVSRPRPAAAAARLAANRAAPQAPAITYPLPPGVRFLHTASALNILGDSSTLNNPATTDRPLDLVFATHNWNPGGEGGLYNDHAVGIYYQASVSGLGPAGVTPGRWALFNEGGAAFGEGLAYNIMVTPPSDRAFFHTTNATNTTGGSTYIDNEWLNGRLDRIPFILHNHSPNSVYAGVDVTAPLGIDYDALQLQWAIFTEDGSALPEGVTFNVMVGLPGATVFTHTASVDNTASNYTYIDRPLANGHPNALILVTQNLNPDGLGFGVINNHHVGVFYDTGAEKWAIYNEDHANIPIGTGFSVLIDEAKLFLPSLLR
jgi:hypothetical protein